MASTFFNLQWLQFKIKWIDFKFTDSHWLYQGNVTSHRKLSELVPHKTELCDFYVFCREIYSVILALVLAGSKCWYLQCISEKNENVKHCKSFKATITQKIAWNFKLESWVCFGRHLCWTFEPLKSNLLQWRMCVFTQEWEKRESFKCLPYQADKVPTTFFSEKHAIEQRLEE